MESVDNTESAATVDVMKLDSGFRTLLVTLRAREQDALRAKSRLNDNDAVKTVSRILATGYKYPRASHYVYVAVARRAREMDQRTQKFLDAYPQGAIVLHLGCAFDSRSRRVKWQRENVTWIDVDQKDVVDMRRQLVDPPDLPDGQGEYYLLGLTEYTSTWLADHKIPNDRPVIAVMEGLTMYLSEATNLSNFTQIAAHFGKHGGMMIWDFLGRGIVILINLSLWILNLFSSNFDFQFRWFMVDPKYLENAVPALREVRFESIPVDQEQVSASYIPRLMKLLFFAPLMLVLSSILPPSLLKSTRMFSWGLAVATF